MKLRLTPYCMEDLLLERVDWPGLLVGPSCRWSMQLLASVSLLTASAGCPSTRPGLRVGLEEGEGSMLCLYDLGISRVVKAVVIPGRITAIEPLVSYGGASASTQHLHQSLRWFFGVAAVVTDVGHVLLVDLCLDDLSCSQSELEASGEIVTDGGFFCLKKRLYNNLKLFLCML
ncbi:protein ELYS-like [Misgurnus anguillicaudatus]|uniref:protein ELYS-like n=1 Tax=Misgurnus anguillicaudatus TaxID=75329 RepID=UPI003CCFDED8